MSLTLKRSSMQINRGLTLPLTFCYTTRMVKQLKNLGLLDRDFVTTLCGMTILILVAQVI